MVKYLPELHNKIWLSSSDDQMATKTDSCIYYNVFIQIPECTPNWYSICKLHQ